MLNILVLILLTIGVFALFDARRIVKNYFTFEKNRNELVRKVEIVGYVCIFIAMLILFLIKII